MAGPERRHLELARLILSQSPVQDLEPVLMRLLSSQPEGEPPPDTSILLSAPPGVTLSAQDFEGRLAFLLFTLELDGYLTSDFWRRLVLEWPSRAADILRVSREWKGFVSEAHGALKHALSLNFSFSTDDDDVVRSILGPPQPPARIVNTGLSEADRPGSPVDQNQCLITNREYCFWLEVGGLVEGTIEEKPVALPDDLPSGALLRVVLFSSPGGIALQHDAEQGMLRIEGSGRVVVERPAWTPPSLASHELVARRLFFPVRTPQEPGTYRLRCNIHHEGLLVQSRDVVLTVAERPQRQSGALRSQVDYALSRTLSTSHLHELGSATVSVLLNDDDRGSHGFRFVGGDDYHASVHLDDHMIQEMISLARQAFRQASWGSPERYEAISPRPPYRYQGMQSEARLREDLVRMARIGYRLYDRLAEQLGKGANGADALRERMRRPGQIQLALRQGARHLVPMAIFYDHPLDTALENLTLCEAFLRDSAASEPLEKSVCFQGDCPHQNNLEVVCPSGFWGFRHTLALPFGMAIQDSQGQFDLPSVLRFREAPGMVIAVSEDPDFVLRENHLARLQSLPGVAPIQVARSRKETLELLRQPGRHLVYFYCHGGVDPGTRAPFLQVGPLNDPFIFRDTLRTYGIQWREPAPHPLVFINGCHTTELEPEQAIELVSGFVERAGAAGVIGTEITLFEPLAVSFASRFLDSFLRRKLPLGSAVREARLSILQDEFNPLGLVYLPFALSALHLAEETGTA